MFRPINSMCCISGGSIMEMRSPIEPVVEIRPRRGDDRRSDARQTLIRPAAVAPDGRKQAGRQSGPHLLSLQS